MASTSPINGDSTMARADHAETAPIRPPISAWLLLDGKPNR